MAYYAVEEQETLMGYNKIDDYGTIYTTIPADIRKYKEIVNNFREEIDDEGRVIMLEGRLPKEQIKATKARKKRNISDEQRKVLAERAKMAQLGRKHNKDK